MAAPPRPAKAGAKPWLKGEVDDLASLANLDDKILLEELKHRYDADKIYTYVGDILVAVNPFRPLQLYTKQHEALYNDSVKSTAPPHIFAIADQAYHALKRNNVNQCAVISGESGAGKTESAKYLMKHIIHLCHMGSAGAALEQRIIEVNPLLEAMGNAQTLMNHNSSRFGKYTELNFDSRGAVAGAKISHYLLEKSRVVLQNPGENNFHILYYIFSSPQKQRLALTDLLDFPYVARCKTPPKNTQEMYNGVVKALDTVGFSSDEQEAIHSVLGAILHLGNVTFDAIYAANAAAAEFSCPPRVTQKVAELLGVPEDKLKEGLTFTLTFTRGEAIKRQYSCEQATDTRDALAKALYGRLFSWIIKQINELLTPGLEARKQTREQFFEIGILDIFGFEHFKRNGFEQLCINLANEQLQHFFNQHIFQYELEEYRREGIDGSNIKFVDNQPLLDLFMNKPIGLFALLDEECRFPKSTDQSLITKLSQQLSGKPGFEPAKTSELVFTISHYAGDVTYHASGFLEKNRDRLASDLCEMCSSSSTRVVSSMFLEEHDDDDGLTGKSRSLNTARRMAKTVGAQFVASLRILIDKMQRCQAHFVRCIKPNMNQAPNQYIDDFVDSQLRYTGMLETTRIRREGYSFRPTFFEFMNRFGILAYGPNARVQPSAETCRKVLNMSGVRGWLVGKTKVFLKYWQVEQLDKSIRLFHENAITLQKVGRGFMARNFRRKMRQQAQQQVAQRQSFFDQLRRSSQALFQQAESQNASDMRRYATGAVARKPPPAPRSAPPVPQKSEKELKREASIMWWKEKEAPRGAGQDAYGNFLPWFHGLISRREAEQLLAPRYIGCFLVRVSENRFGYTLSYRVRDRCRHYIIEQDTQHRYALVGVPKVCSSLNELIEWFSRNRINEDGDMLREPCGQQINVITGEEECDYGELLTPAMKARMAQRGQATGRSAGGGGGDAPPPLPSKTGTLQRNTVPSDDLPPPPVPRAAKPGMAPPIGGGAPPPVNRARKPSDAGGAVPPPVNRARKPSNAGSADAPPPVPRGLKPSK